MYHITFFFACGLCVLEAISAAPCKPIELCTWCGLKAVCVAEWLYKGAEMAPVTLRKNRED